MAAGAGLRGAELRGGLRGGLRSMGLAAMGLAAVWFAAMGFAAATALSAHAGGDGLAPGPCEGPVLEGERRAAELERLQGLAGAVETLSASFRQYKRTVLLKGEIRSGGSLLLGRPGLMRWEVTEPERLVVVSDGRTLWVYSPGEGVVRKRAVADDPGVRTAMEFFSRATHSLGALEERFVVTVRDGGAYSDLSLRPKSALAGRFVESLCIRYGGDGAPRLIELRGRGGALTRTELFDVRLNPPLPADAFTFTPPEGVAVLTGEEDEFY